MIKNNLDNLKYYNDKKILLAHWDCENPRDNASQNWLGPLKKIFGKVITFSPKRNYFIYGKNIMNHKFLDLVRREKPDVIFCLLIYDEFDPKVFLQIKKAFPNIKLITVNADDSWRFEDFNRYNSLFFDYIISDYINALPIYKKEGLNEVSFSCGLNTEYFKPFNLEKKYEVSFIGRAGKDRTDYMRFLLKNGVKVNIWGDGWGAHPEFKEVYHGVLSSEEWPKIVSQSKINLSFSIGGDGKPQFKGRPLEVSACNSFCLVEYCEDYLKVFRKNEVVMFKEKKDLLEKINYYLANEPKRIGLANLAYHRVIKDYDVLSVLSKVFKSLMKKNKPNLELSLSKKVKYLEKKDFKDIKGSLKGYDYVCFKTNCKINSLKDYFQVHSLEKSGKEISCCDYYVTSKNLGNYLLFKSKQSFKKIGKKANRLLNPAQLMVRKDYFMTHLEQFKEFLSGKVVDIITGNAVFISIPLLEVREVKTATFQEMKDSFQMKFIDKLSSLYLQKKLLPLSNYLIDLTLKSLNGKAFILQIIKETLSDKSKLGKFNALRGIN